MLLIGQFEYSIDDKGRLPIPKEIRATWSKERDGEAWYAMPWIDGAVRLYTEAQFLLRAEAVTPATLTPSEDEAELQRLLFGQSARLTLDSAHRVRLPDTMMKVVGLDRQVVLIGCGDRLEVRGREAWAASQQERLAALPELLRRIEAKRSGVQA